jgi:hypothetical protein
MGGPPYNRKKTAQPQKSWAHTGSGSVGKGLADMPVLCRPREDKIQQVYDKSALAQFQLKLANFSLI